jgi:hypothetical protein
VAVSIAISRIVKEASMFTLSIEHAITDFPTWKSAFDRFAEARTQAGVVADRIRQRVDDPRYLVIELDFPTLEQAEGFGAFLTKVVWANRDSSPALASAPSLRILESAATGSR